MGRSPRYAEALLASLGSTDGQAGLALDRLDILAGIRLAERATDKAKGAG